LTTSGCKAGGSGQVADCGQAEGTCSATSSCKAADSGQEAERGQAAGSGQATIRGQTAFI
jgi:hypothetical protein